MPKLNEAARPWSVRSAGAPSESSRSPGSTAHRVYSASPSKTEATKPDAAPYVRRILELIGEDSALSRGDFERASGIAPWNMRRLVAKLAWRSYRFRRENGLRPIPTFKGYTATPSLAVAERQYRSTYESRLGDALERLGVTFRYESHAFDYEDSHGRTHWYTPDFCLPDLHMTFVEVKGIAGASAVDRYKHSLVLRRHRLTLLLWDAGVIDLIESMTDAAQLVSLIQPTRIAA
jgi:hypothetical protein